MLVITRPGKRSDLPKSIHLLQVMSYMCTYIIFLKGIPSQFCQALPLASFLCKRVASYGTFPNFLMSLSWTLSFRDCSFSCEKPYPQGPKFENIWKHDPSPVMMAKLFCEQTHPVFQCVRNGKIWVWPRFPVRAVPQFCPQFRRSSRSHLVMMLFLGSRDMNTGRVQCRDEGWGIYQGFPQMGIPPKWMVYKCLELKVPSQMDDLGLPLKFSETIISIHIPIFCVQKDHTHLRCLIRSPTICWQAELCGSGLDPTRNGLRCQGCTMWMSLFLRHNTAKPMLLMLLQCRQGLITGSACWHNVTGCEIGRVGHLWYDRGPCPFQQPRPVASDSSAVRWGTGERGNGRRSRAKARLSQGPVKGHRPTHLDTKNPCHTFVSRICTEQISAKKRLSHFAAQDFAIEELTEILRATAIQASWSLGRHSAYR